MRGLLGVADIKFNVIRPLKGQKSSSAVGAVFVFGAAIVVGIMTSYSFALGAPSKYKIDDRLSQG